MFNTYTALGGPANGRIFTTDNDLPTIEYPIFEAPPISLADLLDSNGDFDFGFTKPAQHTFYRIERFNNVPLPSGHKVTIDVAIWEGLDLYYASRYIANNPDAVVNGMRPEDNVTLARSI